MAKVQYYIHTLEEVILVLSTGSYDLTMTRQYISDLKREVEKVCHGQWAILCVLGQQTLNTADSEAEWQQVMEYTKQKGMTCTAIVNANIVMEDQFHRMNQPLDAPFGYFSDLDQALLWMKSRGFSLSKSRITPYFVSPWKEELL